MNEHVNISLPQNFKEKISAMFGAAGSEWLDSLPQVVDEYLDRWKLKLSGHFEELSFNFVLPVERENGNEAILKIGLHAQGRLREVAALQHFGGNGSIHVLEFDEKTGVSLLERAIPGRSLKEMFLQGDEDLANKIACDVISRLQLAQPPKDSSPFTNVSEWAKGFHRFLEAIPDTKEHLETDIRAAQKVFDELLQTTSKEVVLHADLHHDNILSSGQNLYTAIDPKGMFGDPVYELGAWIRNPMPEIIQSFELDKVLVRRIHMMSKVLGFDRNRIWSWAYPQAWLAVIWAIEDNSADFNSWQQIARKLEGIKSKV